VAAVIPVPVVVQDLLKEFPAICSTGTGTWRKPKHSVEHVIETTGRAVTAKPRRLDPAKRAVAEAEFRELEAAGIVRRSNSPWSSPLHMVPKPNGKWRPCGDYRRLNVQTVPDSYPLPNVQDFSNKLHGCVIFSKIDLVKGYHQVPVSQDSIAKTAITTPFGMFEYMYMPFGLRNAAQTFQRLMDQCFQDLDFLFTYLDDHLIFSESEEQHLLHLRTVFERLDKYGFVINPEKCEFMQSEITFLGHRLSAGGMAPVVEHVAAVESFPQPVDLKQLQRFLGLLNYYRRFVPGMAKILVPLTNATAGKPKGKLVWTQEMLDSFQAAKAALAAAVPLHFPDPAANLSLAVDASGSHVGAVLQQQSGVFWQPLSFFSRKLSAAEQRYSAFDRELLAIYLAIRHFRFMLEGREFLVFTDHMPLLSALKRVSPPWTARQQRHLSFISEFNLHLVHTPGVENVVADSLSRPGGTLAAVETAPPPIDWAELAAAQQSDTAMAAEVSNSSLQLTTQLLPTGIPLSGDISTGYFRPLVPQTYRRRVFDSLHGMAHPGTKATKRLLSARYVWPGMAGDIATWCRQCISCQKAKVHRHVHLPPEAIPVPPRRFTHLHVDLVGPLPPSNGFQYIFTIIDRTSRWVEAVPLAAITAADCAKALFEGWITRYGVPAAITSDRGAQFTSAVWKSVCQLLNISHHSTTSFHPQSNGMVERWHRRLKDSLRARAAGADWAAHLPWVLLALRAAPHDDSGHSPAEALFGTPVVLPGQFLDAAGGPPPTPDFFREVSQSLHGQRQLYIPNSDPPELPADLLHADMVFIRVDAKQPPLSPVYTGPYKVLERSLRFFKIKIGDRVDTVSTLRLKAAYVPASAVPASPPRRGRPPKLTVTAKKVSFSERPVVIHDRPKRICRPPDRLSY
jgi:transposase InsO family protein